jgi:PGF-pre-PGF domain-containing protein
MYKRCEKFFSYDLPDCSSSASCSSSANGSSSNNTNVLKSSYLLIFLIISLLFMSILFFSINSLPVEAKVNIYQDALNKINSQGYADVIILIDESSNKIEFNEFEDFNIDSEDDFKIELENVNAVKEGHTLRTGKIQSELGADNSKILKDVSISELTRIKGFDSHHHLQSLNGYSGRLTAEGLEELENEGISVTIYYDTILYVLDDLLVLDDITGEKVITKEIVDTAVVDTEIVDTDLFIQGSNLNSGLLASPLDVSTASVRANYSWNVMNVTGRNVKVGVIDTGIDYTHPDLGGCFGYGVNTDCRVFDGYNIVDGTDDPMDDHVYSHGTQVAGILAANGNLIGVAPDAIMYAFKACNSFGSCSSSDVIMAMDWAKNMSVDIVSLSIGFWVGDVVEGNSGLNAVSRQAEILSDAGIIVVIAAGNSGPGVSTILAPADSKSIISVGAVLDKGTVSINDDEVWLESSRGPSLLGRLDPEIVAPGYGINSTKRNMGYDANSVGTSMAAPFVSGAAALLLEAHPSLTPKQIRAILMQSAGNINDKVFAKGTGELDVRNALEGRIYALISQINTYNTYSVDDRWEFVTLPSVISRANITIYNDNDYDISLDLIIDDIISMEMNNFTLEKSQLKVPSEIIISAQSNYTFEINFTLNDFNSTYKTTYGGLIVFNGSGNNGTSDVSKIIRIPIIITVPFTEASHVQRVIYTRSYGGYMVSEYPHDDVYHYCYYNFNPRNLSILINWSSTSNDLDLYLYNSSANIDQVSGNGGTESESVQTSNLDRYRWFRIDGYDIASVPFTFDINISSFGNNIPYIISITDNSGLNNGTDTAPLLIFYRPEDIIINVSYYDADKDSLNITINDSEFIITNEYFDTDTGYGYITFEKPYNNSILRNTTLNLTLIDEYGGELSRNINIMMYSSIMINGQNPQNGSIYLMQNDTYNFSVDVYDINDDTLYFYWSIDDDLNFTSIDNPYYFFDSAGLEQNVYLISVLISNNASTNETNETLYWNVQLDAESPLILIQNPINTEYDFSRIDINYTISDSLSGINNCWMNINSSSEVFGGNNYSNTLSLASCTNSLNSSVYLYNGEYLLTIYSKDNVGNTGYNTVSFNVNDTTPPIILSRSPSGTNAYTLTMSLTLVTDENATCKYDSSPKEYSLMAYSFSSSSFNYNSVSHSASTGVVTGLNTFYILCMDMSNNTNELSNISFSINAAPPSGGNSGSGGTGTGTGTGGSSVYSPDGESSVTGVVYEYVEGDTDIPLDNDDIPVKSISITMNGSGSNTWFKVSKILNPESNYSDIVYAYLKVDAQNFDFEQLQYAKLSFTVKTDWLILNNISKDNVILLRYDDLIGNWTSLLTELSGESDDGNDTYYVSHTPGFGLFAITRDGSKEQPSPTVNLTIELPINNTDNKTGSISAVSKKKSNEGKGLIERVANLSSDTTDAIRNMSFEWIISILFSVFVSVLIIGLAIRKQTIVEYKEDVILGTEKELSKSKDNILLEELKLEENKIDDIEKSLQSITKGLNKGVTNSKNSVSNLSKNDAKTMAYTSALSKLLKAKRK